jgi:23S rRNA (adenine2030-N6)-methyltransferase
LFSYRHAFHAGNHADVLKHAVLLHILDYLNRKDTPYWVVDTHAGAGLYRLDSEWARQNAEFADGIGRLWDRTDLPPLLARYIEAVKALNPHGRLQHYPGSPWLALEETRPADRVRLFEMHPTEIQVLVENIGKRDRDDQRKTTVYDTDGFEGMKSLLPPPPRRGLVLVDPSYEDKRDYRRAYSAVKEGLKRFATGTYMVWYPMVQRHEAQDLPRQLERLDVKHCLHAWLSVRKPSAEGVGLHGSGVFVVNPPWTLKAALDSALPWLAQELDQDGQARYGLTHRGD